ncbi:NADAR family protein [Deinococcus wulumuqiensis]
MIIDRFRGEAFFLSNFYPHPVRLGGALYPSAEAAFQAAKTLDPVQRERIRACPTPAAARAAGRRVTLRPGWDALRLDVMRGIIRQKFRNPRLARALLATGDAHLEEGNAHGDRFWGTVGGQGENWLGRMLMETRAELQAHVPERA